MLFRSRRIWVNPTISDLYEFKKLYLDNAKKLAFDIETKLHQVSCISFAPSKDIALVVPFIDETKKDLAYWGNIEDEIKAWKFVRDVLALPAEKVAQNGLFDIQYLWRVCHIPVHNFIHDTMLLHHALFIELPKDLGFLGSIYTNEAPWKLMRVRAKDIVEKKDD